jgi:hypothetical protein
MNAVNQAEQKKATKLDAASLFPFRASQERKDAAKCTIDATINERDNGKDSARPRQVI